MALLWEVARIPDFRKQMSDQHTKLLGTIFGHLAARDGRLPDDWVAKAIARLDDPEGDIDRLLQKIAAIRTWTYVSHRADWLADAATHQAKARAVEDRLSDALHERLTQRFVDRRNAVIVRKLADGSDLLASVAVDGEVRVEGIHAGRLDGFEFRADPTLEAGAPAVRAAANRALRRDIGVRVARLVDDPDGAFDLAADGRMLWNGHGVARLAAGARAVSPEIALGRSDLLEPAHRQAVMRRLGDWLGATLRARLAPLFRIESDDLPPAARGLAFELVAALGAVPAAAMTIAPEMFDRSTLGALGRAGVRVGAYGAFVPALKDHGSTKLRALLWTVHAGSAIEGPPIGRISFRRDAHAAGLLQACLYLPAGPLAIRADRLEKLSLAVAVAARGGAFALEPGWARLVDCEAAVLPSVVADLGYRMLRDPAAGGRFIAKKPKAARTAPPADMHSPFAVLAPLKKP